MSENNRPLKIFIAMPGTDMGTSARWKNPEDIKKYFFQRIGDKLKEDLQRPVDLVIEKDKDRSSASIHASMFREAWEADIYIADLTGNNPNVYLELGVRWALKDNVTIVVSQDVKDIKFNVSPTRVFQYSDDPPTLSSAVEKVVKAIEAGIRENNDCDSPVRLNAEIISYRKEDIKKLEDEIELLKSAQGRDYLTAGRSSNDPEYRLLMFRKAIEINGALIEGYLDLAVELRKLGKYDEAIVVLQRAISLNPHSAEFRREQGVVYSKREQFEEAVNSLREAVRLDPKDVEAWSNLGGALRRLGMKKLLDDNDWDILRDARNSYDVSYNLDDRNAYALGNVARLDLILSKIEPDRKSHTIDEFETLRHLCSIKLKKAPKDYWLKFDLADTHLLSGEVGEGYRLYREAVQFVPVDYRESVLSSVISPLEEFLSIGVVEDQIKATIEKIIEELKQTSSA